MSLGGNVVAVGIFAETLQMAFDCGAKRILIPMSSVTDIPTVPGELFAKFQTSFYSIQWMRCLRRWEWIDGF
jgi:ATP-dependent Lon protease